MNIKLIVAVGMVVALLASVAYGQVKRAQLETANERLAAEVERSAQLAASLSELTRRNEAGERKVRALQNEVEQINRDAMTTIQGVRAIARAAPAQCPPSDALKAAVEAVRQRQATAQ